MDRYKQLLLKQRDIMIALTSRLNERDETIIQLQEELDAYDRIHKDTEQLIEVRQARVAQLEEFIREVCKIEPPQQMHPYVDGDGNIGEDPFYPSQVVFNNNERRYPAAITDDYQQQPQMLNADEKINELGSLLEQQQLENDHLREQLDQRGADSFKCKECVLLFVL